MKYRIRSNGAVVDIYGLIAAFPNTYIPFNPTPGYLDGLGVDGITETPAPLAPSGQIAEITGATQQPDGSWQTVWTLRAMVPAEQASYAQQAVTKWENGKKEASQVLPIPTITDTTPATLLATISNLQARVAQLESRITKPFGV